MESKQFANLFPNNPSFWEEFDRLFYSSVFETGHCDSYESVMEEFRQNGRDSEYCPELDRPSISTEDTKKKKKIQQCVFCKNNGEMAAVYKTHNLKDDDGIIVCPILRKYTCPICGCTGDNAHTLKYCPFNEHGGVPNTKLRLIRTATGKRKYKRV